jgi:hypothetical protein
VTGGGLVALLCLVSPKCQTSRRLGTPDDTSDLVELHARGVEGDDALVTGLSFYSSVLDAIGAGFDVTYLVETELGSAVDAELASVESHGVTLRLLARTAFTTPSQHITVVWWRPPNCLAMSG